jgi:hypothetical protein
MAVLGAVVGKAVTMVGEVGMAKTMVDVDPISFKAVLVVLLQLEVILVMILRSMIMFLPMVFSLLLLPTLTMGPVDTVAIKGLIAIMIVRILEVMGEFQLPTVQW